MKRSGVCGKSGLLVLVTVVLILAGAHPARAQLQYWVDFTTSFQALDSDTGVGGSERGFTGIRSNIHLYRSIAPGVNAYTELHLVRGSDVEFNQFYVTLDELVDPLIFKVGRFELDYGISHYSRTDNAEAGDNFFVGNTLVDPFDTQEGVQTTYQGARFYLRGALTTGTDQPGFTSNRAFGKTVKLYHQPWSTFKWGLSFHAANQSLTTETASFLVEPAGEAYAGLASGDTTTTTVTSPGGGNNLETFQLDMNYEMTPAWTMTGALGLIRDDTGSISSELEYGSLTVRRRFENDLTLATRLGLARYDSVDGTTPSGDEVRRLQVALSQPLTDNVLGKVEYVRQDVDDALGTALSTRQPIEFDGFISQLHVTF